MKTIVNKRVNPLDDSGAIFHYHRQMISLHGSESPLALGWRNKESQEVRFKALFDISSLSGKSVLDVGCGYADLFSYLPSPLCYYGIEQIPELIDEAIARYGHLENAFFISGNFMSQPLPVVDFVLASGSLNYGSNDPAYIYNAITRLFQHCRIGLGFNLLSNVTQNGLLVAYNPAEITSYCRTLSPNVVLKRDYEDEDFTVFIYR